MDGNGNRTLVFSASCSCHLSEHAINLNNYWYQFVESVWVLKRTTYNYNSPKTITQFRVLD